MTDFTRDEVIDIAHKLVGADLRGIDLGGADLRYANLWKANLREANLIGANLWKANLSGADRSGTDMSGAILSEANLSGANLNGASLSGSKYTVKTTWPEGFDPEAAGALLVEDACRPVRSGCIVAGGGLVKASMLTYATVLHSAFSTSQPVFSAKSDDSISMKY